MSDEKKIIVDSDWKEQVKKEKEILAEQEKTKEGVSQEMQMPEASFEILVNLLATQAAYGLGLIPGEDGEPVLNLPVSKLNIDLLDVLAEKSKGNLTEDETNHIKDTLAQLRMSFVYMTAATSKENE